MADDILITVGADVKGVITAIDATTRLENRVKKLVKAFETGRISPEQFNAAVSKLAESSKAYGKQVDGLAKALLAANKAEKEAIATAKQAKKEAQDLAKARKEQLAVERKAKEEARAFAQVRRQAEADNRAFDAQQKQDIANTKAQAAEKERLAAKYVPLYAASKQYERALEEINRAQELGIISDKQRSTSIEQLNADFAAGTGAFSTYATEAGRRTNQIGVVTQQVGYQVGDFLVQIQSGTNALVAFGQQATQLVGVLPLMGAGFLGLSGGALIALSAGLGILIPLVTALGAAFMRTSGGGKTLQQTVDELKTSTQALATVTEGYTLTGLVDLEEKYGQVNAQVLQLIESQKFLAQSELNKSIADTTKALRDLAGARWFDLGISDRASSLLNLQTQFDVTKQDAEVLLGAFEEMASAEKGSLAQADALARISSLLKIVLQNTDDVTQAQLDALKAVVDTEAAIREMNAAAPKASWMNAAREGVAGLYQNIVAAITKVKELKNEGSPTRPQMRPMDLEATFEEDRARGQTRPRSRQEALFGEFFGSPDTASDGGGGGGKTEAERMQETIAKFEDQLILEKELVGVSEARKRVLQALGTEFVNNNQAAVANYEAQIEAITEATRLEEQRKQIMDTVQSSLESGFMAMVDGTKSVKDAFKDMARQIIAELYRVLVVQRMVGAISGAVGGFFGGGSSLAPTTSPRPPMRPFANGGVVNGPTMFPMSGGQTGLMGEAGPEAIMPLKRDKNGRLGVSVDGGSGAVNVVNNINVTGGSDPAAIRMEVAKLMPQITNATKTAVIDARRRGGQMRAAFG